MVPIKQRAYIFFENRQEVLFSYRLQVPFEVPAI
ncbi:unnamed protein product [Larinioides sclopetarius]|uniref:Uncharacterized protein n=1 Tax=Larinioides sclopetarius TaxID=280406 RepID=A0AAV1YRP7_9ARAC